MYIAIGMVIQNTMVLYYLMNIAILISFFIIVDNYFATMLYIYVIRI